MDRPLDQTALPSTPEQQALRDEYERNYEAYNLDRILLEVCHLPRHQADEQARVHAHHRQQLDQSLRDHSLLRVPPPWESGGEAARIPPQEHLRNLAERHRQVQQELSKFPARRRRYLAKLLVTPPPQSWWLERLEPYASWKKKEAAARAEALGCGLPLLGAGALVFAAMYGASWLWGPITAAQAVMERLATAGGCLGLALVFFGLSFLCRDGGIPYSGKSLFAYLGGLFSVFCMAVLGLALWVCLFG